MQSAGVKAREATRRAALTLGRGACVTVPDAGNNGEGRGRAERRAPSTSDVGSGTGIDLDWIRHD